MLRVRWVVVGAALGLVAAACGNSKPANDATEVDMGSGKGPQTEDAGTGSPAPADNNGMPNEPAMQGPPGGVPDGSSHPGGNGAPGTGTTGPG